MTKVGIVIQARMGSSRFPGKMLCPLGKIPLVEWVVRRLQNTKNADVIILATTNHQSDDLLAEKVASLQVEVLRGEEDDVLKRFVDASTFFSLDAVVRVCGDNPFVDPTEIDLLICEFLSKNCDYAFNHQSKLNSGYADGFGAEIIWSSKLQEISRVTYKKSHREHVTSYIWENLKEFHVAVVQANEALRYPNHRFDVNTESDLHQLQGLVDRGISIESTANDILKVAVSDSSFSLFSDISEQGLNVDDIDKYLKKLFPICRSVAGAGNQETLEILREIVPLNIKGITSGASVYDWKVPKEWKIRDAWIADSDGNKIVKFDDNNLHLVNYSVAVDKKIEWTELKDHVFYVSYPNGAIPYRTSYYEDNWGFCVTKNQYERLSNLDGPLHVYIDSDHVDGSMVFGELLIQGKSSKEILISCYICHPSMANDSLSGVILTAFLAKNLLDSNELNYSYRIVFVPETIGAIAYCATNEKIMRSIDQGLVITTVGGNGKFGYKQSFNTSHPINSLVEEAFAEMDIVPIRYPFDVHGSDERQYSSQGFRINIVTITKDKYYEYDQYHTSLDDLNYVNGEQIASTLEIYLKFLSLLDSNLSYKNTSPNCEVMLSRHGLYPKIGGEQRPSNSAKNQLDLVLWLLFLCDGSKTLFDIAKTLEISMGELIPVAKNLEKKGLIIPI